VIVSDTKVEVSAYINLNDGQVSVSVSGNETTIQFSSNSCYVDGDSKMVKFRLPTTGVEAYANSLVKVVEEAIKERRRIIAAAAGVKQP
jgi:hypothetical protein